MNVRELLHAGRIEDASRSFQPAPRHAPDDRDALREPMTPSVLPLGPIGFINPEDNGHIARA